MLHSGQYLCWLSTVSKTSYVSRLLKKYMYVKKKNVLIPIYLLYLYKQCLCPTQILYCN